MGMSSVVMVAVGGGSGSGKTTIVKLLAKACSDLKPLVLEQDHYYFDLSHLPHAEREGRNYDHPNAIDMDLIYQHLKLLSVGACIDRPIYDFVTHTRASDVVRLQPTLVVLFDGIHALHRQDIRELFDLRVFVHADDDVRLSRRLIRDVHERGRTMQSVVDQYMQSVRPMYQQFVQLTKSYSDFIIDWTDYNQRALEHILSLIRYSVAAKLGVSES